MPCRRVRGATAVETDTAEEILEATLGLLRRLTRANELRHEEIASAIFTVTSDTRAAFLAPTARQLGWQHVVLLDALEVPVPGAVQQCIGVLIHWNTTETQQQVRHICLRGAAALRADLSEQL